MKRKLTGCANLWNSKNLVEIRANLKENSTSSIFICIEIKTSLKWLYASSENRSEEKWVKD